MWNYRFSHNYETEMSKMRKIWRAACIDDTAAKRPTKRWPFSIWILVAESLAESEKWKDFEGWLTVYRADMLQSTAGIIIFVMILWKCHFCAGLAASARGASEPWLADHWILWIFMSSWEPLSELLRPLNHVGSLANWGGSFSFCTRSFAVKKQNIVRNTECMKKKLDVLAV